MKQHTRFRHCLGSTCLPVFPFSFLIFLVCFSFFLFFLNMILFFLLFCPFYLNICFISFFVISCLFYLNIFPFLFFIFLVFDFFHFSFLFFVHMLANCSYPDACRLISLISQIEWHEVCFALCSTHARFALAIRYVLRLRAGSICWLAPVCGSWVFVSRGATGRNKAFPMGYPTSPSARRGNLMVSRLVLLLYLLRAKQCMWIIEQPASSLLHLHTRFQEWLKQTETHVFRVHLDMGAYGHSTRKPTHLYSSHECIGLPNDWFRKFMHQCGHPATSHSLTLNFSERIIPGELAMTCASSRISMMQIEFDPATGKRKYRGLETLKQSQHYPEPFGIAVGEMFAKVPRGP